jgi:hypothetical protein
VEVLFLQEIRKIGSAPSNSIAGLHFTIKHSMKQGTGIYVDPNLLEIHSCKYIRDQYWKIIARENNSKEYYRFISFYFNPTENVHN